MSGKENGFTYYLISNFTLFSLCLQIKNTSAVFILGCNGSGNAFPCDIHDGIKCIL